MKKELQEMKTFLEKDDFVNLDILLEEIHTSWNYSEDQINEYWDIFQEATLYSEFKKETYREESIKLINEL